MNSDVTVKEAAERGVGEYVAGVRGALANLDLPCLQRMAARLHESHRTGSAIYCMGNGGSAATATHLATDLARLTVIPSSTRRIRAMSLSTNAALLTACGNDDGFDQVFVEQLRGVLRPGDVVIGVSTSGRSLNVLEALRYARALGAGSLAVTGRGGTDLRAMVDELLVIDSTSVQVVEDLTMVAAHALCLLAREQRLATGE